ncbi:MAG: NAD(P)H-binding protein [Oligoflexales bacterium]
MKVAIFGYTGLVGKSATNELIQAPWCQKIIAIGRNPPKTNHQKIDYSPTHFEASHSFWPHDLQCDAVIWCLGSTLKKSGSKKSFYHIDFKLASTVAKKAKASGVQHWVLISSAGAHPQSYFFYNRVKGELENFCLKLNFPKTTILRPGLLIGSREESRPLESFSQKLLQPLASSQTRWFDTVKPVYAHSVARTAVQALKQQKSPIKITHSGEITRITHHSESL